MERRTREEWREDVGEWVRSGRSCREYAESVGLNPKSLSWWKWHLTKAGETFGASDRADTMGGLKFVEVGATAVLIDREPPSRVEVVWGDAIIRVPDGFEPETLSRVLSTLEARS